MKRFLLFIYCLSSTCYCETKPLLEHTAILNQFFHILTNESEAGYVFYNKKPVCIHGYFIKDPFLVNSEVHKQAVALRAGSYAWKKLSHNNSDFLIQICDKEEPSIPGYFHILVINVPLFHQTVNENLSLFKYVLGPTTTSQKLLEAIESNQVTFHSLLKDDKVLIGEILGFGSVNSLYVSRIETIQEAFDKDIPPFKRCELLTKEHNEEYLPCQPSFGYRSVTEELNDLRGKIELSSKKLIENSPEFIFGWLKDSKKEQKSITELELTQDKIRKLISSPSFLETVLLKMTGQKYLLNQSLNYKLPIEKEKINHVVAKGIWESLKNHDYEYLIYFINGFNLEELPSFHINREAWFPDYLRIWIEGSENLRIANEFLSNIQNDCNFQCIVPQKLYYKITQNGYESDACQQSLVSLNYSIFSPEGHCLSQQQNTVLNLKNTISGFSEGIKGMKRGETREIFIHPSLAYGFETPLEKSIHLKAVVTLNDFDPNSDPIPSLTFLDLTDLLNHEILYLRQEEYKKALGKMGSQICRHLSKCDEVDIQEIKNELMRFFQNKIVCHTTQEEQDLINHVHWNIYYGSS